GTKLIAIIVFLPMSYIQPLFLRHINQNLP
ncbi:MAG: hypothetical protein ACI9GZ_002414, partial [Bacteroidia bacterium]